MAHKLNESANCYDAEYVNKMFQIQNDELFPLQILCSYNCDYILIRNPSSILSFYSILDESIIQKWDMNNDSIWSLYISNDPQQVTISDYGCLTWSTQNKSVLTEICFMDQSDTNSSKSVPLLQLLHQNVIFIPILICIIGAFCLLLCFCMSKIIGDKLMRNEHKKLIDEQESRSGSSSRTGSHIPSDEPIMDIDDKDLKTDEIYKYIYPEADIDGYKQDDEYTQDKGNEYESQDVYVSHNVVSESQMGDDMYEPTNFATPNTSQLSEHSALDDIDEQYQLTIPDPQLTVVYSNISEI